jgi:hypothetical protein
MIPKATRRLQIACSFSVDSWIVSVDDNIDRHVGRGYILDTDCDVANID